ncbi:MAG: hypothetical protein IAG10_23780 [Planctomycetaceae bacterium]|nr:hypothetical protein [Planctomycetaceae bacterium]
MLTVVIEVIAWIATAVLAILWIRDSAGNYEPWTLVCGLSAAAVEMFRRWSGHDVAQPHSHRVNEARQPHIARVNVDAALQPIQKKSRPQELLDWLSDNSSEKPLSKLLPRALEFAQVTNDSEFEHWVRLELYGWTKEGGVADSDVVPEYREVVGRYLDQSGRMLDFSKQEAGFMNSYRLRHGVRQLEELAKRMDMIQIRDEIFVSLIREHLQAEVSLFTFSPTEIVAVLDRARNRLIEKVYKIRKTTQEHVPAV